MWKKSKIFFFGPRTPFGPPRPQIIFAQLIWNPLDSVHKNLPGKCPKTSAELGFEIRISKIRKEIAPNGLNARLAYIARTWRDRGPQTSNLGKPKYGGVENFPGVKKKIKKISKKFFIWPYASHVARGSPKTAISPFEEKRRFPCLGVLVRKCGDGCVGWTFFYFFRLLLALAGIRVTWFVEIRSLVVSVVLAKNLYL